MHKGVTVKQIEALRQRTEKILQEILQNNEVEVFGNLKFEIVEMNTLAFIKRNKIYLSIEVRKYPKYVLKYIIAHEVAHLAVKGHTKKFWEIVKRIYPQYEKGKNSLLERLGYPVFLSSLHD